MKKKVYFVIDNGDTPYTTTLSDAIAGLKADVEEMKEEDVELYQWTITPVLLTAKEFKNMPEGE